MLFLSPFFWIDEIDTTACGLNLNVYTFLGDGLLNHQAGLLHSQECGKCCVARASLKGAASVVQTIQSLGFTFVDGHMGVSIGVALVMIHL